MTQTPEAVVRSWIHHADGRDWDALREVMTPDYRLHYPPSLASEPMDRETKIKMLRPMRTRHEIQDIVLADDKVVTRQVLTATVLEDFMGAKAGTELSGVPAMVMWRLKEDRIAEAWVYPDTLRMVQELGAA